MAPARSNDSVSTRTGAPTTSARATPTAPTRSSPPSSTPSATSPRTGSPSTTPSVGSRRSRTTQALLKKAKAAVEDVLSVDDPDADIVRDKKGNPVADSDLRGQETVPLPDHYDPADDRTDWLREGVDEYVKTEVLPHAPEAWPDHDKTRLGYEIPFTRIFYRYEPPRPLEEIDADIQKVEQEILDLLGQVTG